MHVDDIIYYEIKVWSSHKDLDVLNNKTRYVNNTTKIRAGVKLKFLIIK